MSIIVPHRRKAFQPVVGGGYTGVQPDIGIPANDGSGTAVAVLLPGGASDLTASADSWDTGNYDFAGVNNIQSTDNQFSSVFGSLGNQLTLFARLNHVGSWNFSYRRVMHYGTAVAATNMSFDFSIQRNHTNGIYRMNLGLVKADTVDNMFVEADYGATEVSGEHSVGVVIDNTSVQFYFDGSTHGSADTTASGDIDDADSGTQYLTLGSLYTGSTYWGDWGWDFRIALDALTSGEMSTWHDNPVT